MAILDDLHGNHLLDNLWDKGINNNNINSFLTVYTLIQGLWEEELHKNKRLVKFVATVEK